MILHVRVSAGPDEIEMDVPEAAFSVRMPNVVAIDARGRIAGFGDDARSQPNADLKPIFDVIDFDPELTFGFIHYHALLASSRLRSGLAHVLDLFDRFDFDLLLPQYELIPVERRRRFERSLRSFTFARGYSINGEYRRLPPNLLRRSS